MTVRVFAGAGATKSSIGQRSTKIAFVLRGASLLAQSVMPAPVLAASGRPAYPVDLGVLTSEITPDLVDEVIEVSACREKRQRLLLPPLTAAPGPRRSGWPPPCWTMSRHRQRSSQRSTISAGGHRKQ